MGHEGEGTVRVDLKNPCIERFCQIETHQLGFDPGENLPEVGHVGMSVTPDPRIDLSIEPVTGANGRLCPAQEFVGIRMRPIDTEGAAFALHPHKKTVGSTAGRDGNAPLTADARHAGSTAFKVRQILMSRGEAVALGGRCFGSPAGKCIGAHGTTHELLPTKVSGQRYSKQSIAVIVALRM